MEDSDDVAGLADFGVADAADGHILAALGCSGLGGRGLVVEGEGLALGDDEFPLRLPGDAHGDIDRFCVVFAACDAHKAVVTLGLEAGLDGGGCGFATCWSDAEGRADSIVVSRTLAAGGKLAAKLGSRSVEPGIGRAHCGIEHTLGIEHRLIIDDHRGKPRLDSADLP